ncbi:glycosyltransferase family 61 protein [Gluconobacter roseus]|uniref:Glycosyltransferase 61 catalytic domain-containing protein n=1 Tax=Gluconobacter roseus NBRC 3990 TaxID=1307950 RepID=A0A4Y3M3S1_9PROT|nr:glycosyltransferase 61 family protein [Gluconobacter roseus]GBR44750.1 hypothetical protein AA3990_0852 [Gluconobacter roseus NBRC 3990]GEB02726.1 hypothetical protein GRO01_03020 [Gluconobacter roseus NBRC 3990]GLP93185.1 hypothetical protein GCM10007871_11630 [Gluconobacter roseus NBRC 3990]
MIEKNINVDLLGYCNSHNITEDIISKYPEIIQYGSAIIIPTINHSPQSGVFDIYGNAILSAALINGKEKHLGHVNPSYASDVNINFCPAKTKNIYWGGCIVGHYGHFIMDVLPRWWAYGEYKKLGYKLGININDCTESEIFSTDWFRQFLSIMDISLEDIHIFKYTTLVENLCVPYSLIMDRAYYHEKLSLFFNSIGEKVEKLIPSYKFNGEYYLSRKKLRHGTRKIVNESEIEEIMIRNGIEILYPEEMTVYEQIAIFRRARVYGFLSSAFHNSAFSKNSEGLCFSLEKNINRSFSLFDSSSNSKIIYVDTPNINTENDPEFYVCTKVVSLDRLEATLIAYKNNIMEDVVSYERNKNKYFYDNKKNGPFLLENFLGEIAFFSETGKEIEFNIEGKEKIIVFLYGDIAFFCHENNKSFIYGGKFFSAIKDLSNNKYSFRDIDSDLYMSIKDSKSRRILSCDRKNKMGWEEFSLIDYKSNENYFLYLLENLPRLGNDKNNTDTYPEYSKGLKCLAENLWTKIRKL